MKSFWMLILAGWVSLQAQPLLWDRLSPGPHAVGFAMEEISDKTRSFGNDSERRVRVYCWYPAEKSNNSLMTWNDIFSLTAGDFSDEKWNGELTAPPLPVPLVKGIAAEMLERMREESSLSARGARAGKKRVPLIVLAQGLYYESPLTHWILAEYLASQGFCVVTVPLKGGRNRLVQLTVDDLEALVRDLETALAFGRGLPFVDESCTASLGYDMGGMASVLFCMRHPEIRAMATMDAGIMWAHGSGLPCTHPSYDESRFTIPWLHMTQQRFATDENPAADSSALMCRRPLGSTTLMLMNTHNHGHFTSYAVYGMKAPLSGYWPPGDEDGEAVYATACRTVGLYFKAELMNESQARTALNQMADSSAVAAVYSIKKPSVAPSLMNPVAGIISRSPDENKIWFADSAQCREAGQFVNENELNWLGYHFLYWWNRPEEAKMVFRWMTELYPGSSNAFDSLGEACLSLGQRESALKHYMRALELDPRNRNARSRKDYLENALKLP